MKKSLALLFSLLTFGLFAQIEDPVDWSFEVRNAKDGEADLVFIADIEPGWHLYSQDIPEDGPIPTSFIFTEGQKGLEFIGRVTEGEPHEEYDPNFEMTLKYYEEHAEFVQHIKVTDGTLKKVTGELEFMVCNDVMCLPPEYVDFAFDLPEIEPAKMDAGSPSGGKDKMINQSVWTIFLEGMGWGFAALLMPCIFPMIPLTVSFFTKQSKTKSEGIRKAIIYALSINVIYVALGMLITIVFGSDALNAMATNPWFNLFFFALFIVFAISFFGAFEITLPSKWVNKADEASSKGGLIGIFFMAFTLSLVSFSCTGPLIGTLLVRAASQGEYFGPTMGMLGFSLALSLPFMLFAAFPGWLQSLPKSGGWLNTVKVTLGFLELAFALKFLSTADLVWQAHWLERELFLAIWVAIAFLTALYLLGVFRMPHDSPVDRISVSRMLFGLVFVILGFYLLPGIWGAPVKLVAGFPPPEFYAESPGGFGGGGHTAGFTAGAETETGHKTGEHCPLGLPCFNDFEEGLAYAKEVNKPIMLDFTGWGCVNCRKMEENVWSDPRVKQRLAEDVVLISLYVDEQTKLPESEQRVSEDTGKKIKTIGNKWSEFQAVNFKANSQPYYVILGHENLEPLHESAAYDPDIEKFIDWMDRGVGLFEK
ncbi:MAG: thioredoxin family protein [Bacteroidota bacterium]|nr:thioredoxin family protein [Bacteroidota bacterium]